MPIDRSRRLRDQSVVMAGPAEIDLVFAALERLGERGFVTKERAERDVAEEIGYQLVVHPDWVRPHIGRLVREHGGVGLTFDWRCLLMRDAPNDLVEELLERHRTDPDDGQTTSLLMASRSEAAMAALATTARRPRGDAHGPPEPRVPPSRGRAGRTTILRRAARSPVCARIRWVGGSTRGGPAAGPGSSE